MTITQLRTFLVVCDTMSFTDAADRLFLSQTAVSRQVAALEREWNTALFERQHNSLRLTQAGEHLRRSLPSVLEQMDSIMSEVRALGSGAAGILNIGVQKDQKLDRKFAEALRSLRRQNIDIRLRHMEVPDLEQQLSEGNLDAVLTLEVGSRSYSGCERLIYTEEYACVAIHQSLMPERGPKGDDKGLLAAVRATCPILMPDLDRYYGSGSPELYSQEVNGGLVDRFYDLTEISPMVGAGLAASIVNESHTLSVDPEVVLMPLRGLPKIRKGVFWLRESSNASLKILLDSLR